MQELGIIGGYCQSLTERPHLIHFVLWSAAVSVNGRGGWRFWATAACTGYRELQPDTVEMG